MVLKSLLWVSLLVLVQRDFWVLQLWMDSELPLRIFDDRHGWSGWGYWLETWVKVLEFFVLYIIGLLLKLQLFVNLQHISSVHQNFTSDSLLLQYLYDRVSDNEHYYILFEQQPTLMLQKDTHMDDSKMQGILKAWKSKSLNSKYMERYRIEFEKKRQERSDILKKKQSKGGDKEKNGAVATTASTSEFKNQLLPQPKFVKINEQVFCLYLYKCLVIFKFLSQAQKQPFKSKEIEAIKTFICYTHYFEDNIKFVNGNSSQYIYVGFENQLLILKLEYKKQLIEQSILKSKEYCPIKQTQKKQISKIKGLSFIRQLRDQIQLSLIVVVTNDRIIKCVDRMSPNREDRERPVEEVRLSFDNAADQATFGDIVTISILCENNVYLYLFGTKEGVQREMNQKYQGKQRKCQYLYLIKLSLQTKPNEPIRPNFSMIDHVFQTGIFSKSKIYQSGPSVFLISLFEEIIVVKYHFQKYVVWDNISLASSKTNEKKGQLILADKIVMVFTENSQIYAHNIFFSTRSFKLKYPRIDNFKGNVNQDEILYDALVLQYQPGSFMKVLFYFKQHQVYTPNNRMAVHKEDKIQGQGKSFSFYIRCIQQDSPLTKLQELFKVKKTQEEIAEFVQRFNIAEIDKSKCQWSVSDKTEKDIETLLLEIKDNEYIQNQLTTILKSNPHELKFLIKIEKKQVERYKKMLILKLLKHNEKLTPSETKALSQSLDQIKQQSVMGANFSKKEIDQIKQIIKWVMESIMFQKKLLYSKNFLQFMEYDFIQIGKLKAASLKEQIKLLSCKGYEKRLLYFLNSFKYMILDKFEDIFLFLIENKSEQEVQKFFKDNFPFILPKFPENVKAFQQKKKSQVQKRSKERKYTFCAPALALPVYTPGKHQQEQKKRQQSQLISAKRLQSEQDEKRKKNEAETCQLWVSKLQKPDQTIKLQTIKSFEQEISNEIRAKFKEIEQKQKFTPIKDIQAIKQFSMILHEFIKQDWFRNNKSKQHSIIESDQGTLEQRMEYYKRIGVFHLLIKFFYSKIAKGIYRQAKIDEVLKSFRMAELIPESFQANILVRREVYKKIQHKKRADVGLPYLQDFLIYEQTKYFDYIFLNYRQMLLQQVKAQYDKVLQGWFKQIFKSYLDSDKIQLTEIIKFLQFFQGNSNADIRLDVFTCIKTLLKISDKANTSFFVDKLMELEILKKEGNSHSGIDSLIDEAKIAFGYYFFVFFQLFSITETYKELIDETLEPEYDKCKILKTILIKYCREEYAKPQNSNTYSLNYQLDEVLMDEDALKFDSCFGLQQIEFTIKNEPLQFFAIILYLLDTLRFEVPPEIVFDQFINLQLVENNYESIVNFISAYQEYIGGVPVESEQNNDTDQFKSKNYALLRSFYHESPFTVQDRTIDNILIWIRNEYNTGLKTIETSLPTSYWVKNVLAGIMRTFENVVEELGLSSAQLIREKEFMEMICKIKEIRTALAKYVIQLRFKDFKGNYLEENSELLNELSGFNFMIKILKEIPSSQFSKTDPAIIRAEIQNFDKAYDHFIGASKYRNQAQEGKTYEQSGLHRFYMELAIRLIKDKQFAYCKEVLVNKCNQKDPFLQFLALIQVNDKGKPEEKQFKKFVRDFIQTTSESREKTMFASFILQNGLTEFQGSSKEGMGQSAHFTMQKGKLSENSPEPRKNKKQQKTNYVPGFGSKRIIEKFVIAPQFTQIIFISLVESHRMQEAYYFLIRNNVLNIVKASQLISSSKESSSYALICIYVKCLQKFLCEEFYPTLTFYKNKHQILENEFERKDIVKDINIAISRMKEIISQERTRLTKRIQKNLDNSIKITSKIMNKMIDKDMEGSQEKTTDGKEEFTEDEGGPQKNLEIKNKLIEDLKSHLEDLVTLYERFMKSIFLDPMIKLNQEDIKNCKIKLNNMSREITPDEIGMSIKNPFPVSPRFENTADFIKKQQKFSIEDFNKRQQQNERQLELEKRKIKQNPKLMELQKQINNQIRETKMLSQKYEQSEFQLPKQTMEARQKNARKYNELKQRQKADLDSMKSYKSNTASRVQQILEQMKLRKSKICQRSDVKSKYSKVEVGQESEAERSRKNSFDEEGYPNNKKAWDIISPPNLATQFSKQKSGTESNASNEINVSRKYQVKVHGIDGNIKNLFMPVTMSKQQKDSASRVSIQSPMPSNLGDISKIKTSHVRSQAGSNVGNLGTTAKSQSKCTIEDLIKLFSQKDPQCVKYVQKIEIVKNNVQVGLQITKNIYSTINNFDLFVKFIGFLLENYPKYKEILEEKAYKIALQSMGIEHKINLKQLFPIDLFTNVVNVSLKEYYKTAYEIMRPNLLKILAKPETNIHGMAILFRFGFGSENTYYYRVYEDQIKILLKDYSENLTDEKKLFLLAEKLRTLYGNINTENRQVKFEQLMREITNEGKRKTLAREMIKILDRRNQMLTGEKQTDLRDVLVKL